MNVLIAIVLIIGCALSLPIFAWLFVSPLIQAFKKRRTDETDKNNNAKL